MEWIQVFTIIASIIGLFLWSRAEASADRRETQSIMREDRRDLIQISKNIEDEIKDFHSRLIKIEESRK